MIWLCAKCTSNVHKDRTEESRNTKNTYDFSVQVRNFLLPLSLKVFRHKERERHNLSILVFSSAPHLVQHPPKASASKQKLTLLVRCLVSTLLTFFKFPKSSTCFQCMTSPALCNPVSHLGLLWHLWVTHPLCVCMWTPALMLHLSNPGTEPNSSQPI